MMVRSRFARGSGKRAFARAAGPPETWAGGANVPVILRTRPRPQRGEFPAADAADLSRARRARVPRSVGDRARDASPHLSRIPRPLEKARFRAGQARARPRRHRCGHARQHPGDARMPLRRADVRGGSQCAQHPARRRRARLHARPWRSQGAHRRSGVCRRDDRGAEARHGSSAGLRLRRSGVRRSGRADRRRRV